MTKQQILDSTKALIQDIDKCTEDYVKASLNHDHVAYEAVCCERSRLLLAAHQQLTTLYGYIKEGGKE